MNRIKSQKGQALSFLLIMMMILVICWAMMMNIAKLLTDRMMMQNAADNAALSVAVYKARVLNKLGKLNYLMAATLYDGKIGLLEALVGFPPLGLFNYYLFGGFVGPYGVCPNEFAPAAYMLFWDDQKKVASLPDMGHGKCSGRDWGNPTYGENIDWIRSHVAPVKDNVISFVDIQYKLRQPFPGIASFYAREIAKRQAINSKGEGCGADHAIVLPGGLSLGLWRNENGAKYYETTSICASPPPVPLIGFPGFHAHIFWTPQHPLPNLKRKHGYTWLYADRKRFTSSQKIIVTALKYGNSPSNKGYPLFGKWLGIEWPTITTFAAAGVYNREGPMFPLEEKGHPSDRISPVLRAYERAKKGGWDAHLIPVGYYALRH